VQSCNNIPQATALAVENLGEQDALVVCGSLFLAAEVRPLLLAHTANHHKTTK